MSNGENSQLALSRQIKQKLSLSVEEGNSIEGFTVNQGKDSYLLISYGKYYNVDSESNSNEERDVEWNQFEKTEQPNTEVYQVTEN